MSGKRWHMAAVLFLAFALIAGGVIEAVTR